MMTTGATGLGLLAESWTQSITQKGDETMKIQTKHRTNGTGPALDPHKTRARMAVVDDTQPSPATKGKRKAKAPAPVEMLTIQGVIVPKLPKRDRNLVA